MSSREGRKDGTPPEKKSPFGPSALPVDLLLVLATCASAFACNPAQDGPSSVPTPIGPDVTAPTFDGAKHASANSETEVQVTWDAATDDQSAQASIAYLVFVADTPDKLDFSKPVFVTPGGATTAIVGSLKASHSYSFAVRAIDQAGNEDQNTKHVEATTPDVTPPTFAGVTSVKGASPTSLLVSWGAATDNASDAAHIRYSVFLAQVSGKEDYAAPAVVTPYGATSATIDGLMQATVYYVVVRAIDQAGNVTPSTKELSSMVLDATPPTFVGLTSANAVGTTITLKWPAAKDDVDPASSLIYDVFQATAPGAEDFKKPAVSVTGTTTFSSNAFDASTRYCFVVRARDTSGNEDSNTSEQCVVTAASADSTPPTFAGLATATAGGSTTINLAWAPATDDYTPPSGIVYDVYMSTSSLGESFTSPTKSVTGASSTTITGLTPNTSYFFVVRAKDAAGNEETNVVERTAKTLP